MVNKNDNDWINVRVDAKLKEQATRVLDDLGLDMTTAITLYLAQVVQDKRLPFVPDTMDPLDRATTIALNQIARGESEEFDNVDAWWHSLNSN
jgi:DNA-damage-inducible protein J